MEMLFNNFSVKISLSKYSVQFTEVIKLFYVLTPFFILFLFYFTAITTLFIRKREMSRKTRIE